MEKLCDHWRDENKHDVLENIRNWLSQLLQSLLMEGYISSVEID